MKRLKRATVLAFLLGTFALASQPEAGRAADPGAGGAKAPLIDPDCSPEEARDADPALVQEPDGVCTPPVEADPSPAPKPPPEPIEPEPPEPPAPSGPEPQGPGAGSEGGKKRGDQKDGDRNEGGKGGGKKDVGKDGRGDAEGGGRDQTKGTGGIRPPRLKRERSGPQPAPPVASETFTLGGCGPGAVPPGLAPIYLAASRAYQLGPTGPAILAAINEIESGFGANMGPSSAGAIGWMQFMPATWAAYGVDADGDGRRNPWEPKDAIFAAARYLRASGMPEDTEGALWAYNHAGWYVADVLHRARCLGAVVLLEPLPAAQRLDPAFAATLRRVSHRSRVAWELMLALLRVRGKDGPVPASRAELRTLARQLAARGARRHPGRAVQRLVEAWSPEAAAKPSQPRDRAISGERVMALAQYNGAVGLSGLVRGLESVRERLVRKVLRSRRLAIYPGGRSDVTMGVTDVRVLVLLVYLSSSYSEVRVTSLTSGHSYLTASGNISAHSHGRAVDIAALNGTPILGHQEPGGLTERALRRIMLLPREVRPSELISLFELGGPSFALADHADHIHVGY